MIHKILVHAYLCSLIGLSMFACTQIENPKEDPKPVETAPVIAPTPDPVIIKPGIEPKNMVLSWDAKGHRAWSDFLINFVSEELFHEFDRAQDAERFCKNYKNLSRSMKVWMWSELIVQMAAHESSWSPVSRMKETTMGIDPITKAQVWSEGLLQLSYQDIQWAPYCKFDWTKDKDLPAKDPRKTILDPYINLDCGARILGKQILRTGKVILSSGVYWAVLKEGGKYQKIGPITQAVQKLRHCEVKK